MRYLSFIAKQQARLIFIFAFSLLFFLVLEYGMIPNQITDMFQPVIFASVVTAIFIKGKYRFVILRISLILLFLMVILYLLDQIIFASWIGSLGVGISVILIFSYFPKLIKDGHI